VPDEDFDALLSTLQKTAVALKEADIPFLLGGGLACWVRGGPESEHDLDLMIREEHAEAALAALADAGMRTERPPGEWLVKAWDDDVLVDLIFDPAGVPITDAVFERADELEVEAVAMQVMALEDVLVTKLMALGEHNLDYESVLEIARSLREQVDWEDVRARSSESPYALAFFTLVEGLGVAEPPRSGG
jgi:predicted nucleotidyltransferase